MKRFRFVSGAASVATVLLIAAGGLVRATDSGLGCPGWPKCWGRFFPPIHLDRMVNGRLVPVAGYSFYHAALEYSHRLVAGIDVVAVGLTALVAWLYCRGDRKILWASTGAALTVFFQAGLGAIVVFHDVNAWFVAAHYATAMLLTALLVFAFTRSYAVEGAPRPDERGYARLAWATVVATGVLLLAGVYVRENGVQAAHGAITNAPLAFTDWPLMNGRLVPALGGAATAQFVHRVAAAVVTALFVWVFIKARTMRPRDPALVRLAGFALALLVTQVFAGAAIVWTDVAVWAIVVHVTVSLLVWGSIVALASYASTVAPQRVTETEPAAAVSPGGQATPVSQAAPQSLRPGETAAAYFKLAKPRIIPLLLVTTVPAMILAAGRVPSLTLMAATLLGGTLAAASANAINCYVDRDIDAIMRRTRTRPLPAHLVGPENALAFGYILGATSFYFLSITVNVVAAGLALAAIAFYVFVYSLWLKRATAQNIVIGGAAGAVPVLVGWAAVTGKVALPAVVMFAIVFVWTPPHFWALSLNYRKDYEAARVPMLPVVRGVRGTVVRILAYSIALVPVTLALAPIAHLGAIYLAAASILGAVFVYKAVELWRRFEPARSIQLFHYSIVYLTLLFAAVAVDRVVNSVALPR